jgi:hypothetical protein
MAPRVSISGCIEDMNKPVIATIKFIASTPSRYMLRLKVIIERNDRVSIMNPAFTFFERNPKSTLPPVKHNQK